MTTERCPTCGQPLPKGLSRSALSKKIENEQRRAIVAAIARKSRSLRKEIEAELRDELWSQAQTKARREIQPTISRARSEGRHEGEEEAKRTQQQLKEVQRQLALAESRTKDLEGTVKKLNRQISEASPQRRGTVSQDEVRRAIEGVCRADQISSVPTGRRGADVLQEVCENGEVCGKILWEVKDTAAWSETWVLKAKGDGQRIGADYTCIVTASFPKGADGLVSRSGVILVAPNYAACLAPLLRDAVVELHHARLSGQQRGSKAAAILDYVSGVEFKAQFDGIVDSINELRKTQANERNYHDEHWRKEEDLVGKIAAASTGVRSRLSAIARETPVALVARA